MPSRAHVKLASLDEDDYDGDDGDDDDVCDYVDANEANPKQSGCSSSLPPALVSADQFSRRRRQRRVEPEAAAAPTARRVGGEIRLVGRESRAPGGGGSCTRQPRQLRLDTDCLTGPPGLESSEPARFEAAHLNCRSGALVLAQLVARRPLGNGKRAPPMIDRAPGDRVASGAISRPVASAGTCSGHRLAQLLLLLVSLVGQFGLHAHAYALADQPASKLELWRDLLAALPASSGEPPTAGLSALAGWLAQLDDQKRAALIYMELLARLQRATPPAEWTCKRASLAQLTANESQVQAAGESSRAGWTELAAGDQQHAHELERALEGQMLVEPSSDAARLALDNANLLSRLLLAHPVRPLLVSRRFFSYLAEAKARTWLNGLATRQVRVQSVGMVLLTPARRFELGAMAQLAGNSRQPELVELDEQLALEPPVNRWIELAGSSLVEVAAAASSSQGLKLEHGTWSSPFFDCSLTNRWLLTYSVPFFGRAEIDTETGSADPPTADLR